MNRRPEPSRRSPLPRSREARKRVLAKLQGRFVLSPNRWSVQWLFADAHNVPPELVSLRNLLLALLIGGSVIGLLTGTTMWLARWGASQPSPHSPSSSLLGDSYLAPNSEGGGGLINQQEVVSYFFEVAIGAEFGNSDAVIKKWESPIRINVYGQPTAADWETLRAVIADLRELAPTLDIELTDVAPNLELYFVPEREFKDYEPNYQPLNMGFFWVWWDENTINRARVLIASEEITQAERSHLIREELTQALGLMQDSDRYPDSIFFRKWTETNRYSNLDRAIIALLYRPEIRPGMTQQDILRLINGD